MEYNYEWYSAAKSEFLLKVLKSLLLFEIKNILWVFN